MRGLLRPPVVLAYHGVGVVDDDADPKHLVVSPGHLEAHVRYLRARRYEFLTAGELAPATRPAEGTAVLTFDDGWRSSLTGALPLLRAFGVRATFFVCPGLWGAQHPDVDGEAGRLLDESEARALHESGMELGSHTLSHPDLRLLDEDELRRELVESKRSLEGLTGEPCRLFAYPYGLFDEREERAVADAGYELAFAWLPGPWRALAAPRLPAPPRHGAPRLALKLLGVRSRRR
jgi:peptidoglycan/xylan/chitin deacetylase (PgdA/CDA1 family)